jgi:hypothetical protein
MSDNYKHTKLNLFDENDSATIFLDLNPDIRDLYTKSGYRGIHRLFEMRCGAVDIKKISINTEVGIICMDYAIKDKLKIMEGMAAVFGFTQEQIDCQKLILIKWDSKKAKTDAESDFKNGKIQFYYAGSIIPPIH